MIKLCKMRNFQVRTLKCCFVVSKSRMTLWLSDFKLIHFQFFISFWDKFNFRFKPRLDNWLCFMFGIFVCLFVFFFFYYLFLLFFMISVSCTIHRTWTVQVGKWTITFLVYFFIVFSFQFSIFSKISVIQTHT